MFYTGHLKTVGALLFSGSSSKITEQNLKATDIDSDSLKLRYVLTKDPPAGKLQLSQGGRLEEVSAKGPLQSFTQDDVNKGGGSFQVPLLYSHRREACWSLNSIWHFVADVLLRHQYTFI